MRLITALFARTRLKSEAEGAGNVSTTRVPAECATDTVDLAHRRTTDLVITSWEGVGVDARTAAGAGAEAAAIGQREVNTDGIPAHFAAVRIDGGADLDAAVGIVATWKIAGDETRSPRWRAAIREWRRADRCSEEHAKCVPLFGATEDVAVAHGVTADLVTARGRSMRFIARASKRVSAVRAD